MFDVIDVDIKGGRGRVEMRERRWERGRGREEEGERGGRGEGDSDLIFDFFISLPLVNTGIFHVLSATEDLTTDTFYSDMSNQK